MRYGCILVDFPWPFKTYTKESAVPTQGKDQPYKTMKLFEIAGTPIPDLAAKDAFVFLWKPASLPRIPQLLADLWGFKIVTDDVFVWHKTDGIGMGYYSRKESETVCLLKRGSPKRKSKGVRQMIHEPRRENSRKPDIYASIEALVDGPYLEMFARQSWPGWTAMGDEVGKYRANNGV